jgi:hypothetical protein
VDILLKQAVFESIMWSLWSDLFDIRSLHNQLWSKTLFDSSRLGRAQRERRQRTSQKAQCQSKYQLSLQYIYRLY